MRKNIFFGIFIAALCFLCFVTGASLAVFKAFPYSIIHKAYLGGKAAYDIAVRKKDMRISMAWNRQRSPERGVLRYDPIKAFNGYTLYTSTGGQTAHLLSMDGHIAYEWHLPFALMWERRDDLPVMPDTNYVYWRKADVMPNGDLLVIVVEAGMTPWGLALIKIDKNSRLIWKYSKRVHHDFSIGPDGRIFTLTHRIRKTPLGDLKNIQVPFLEDFMAMLSPDGEELLELSLYEALKKSHWSVLSYAPINEKGDYLHANAVEVLRPEQAAAFPFAKAGQLLISMRDINFIGMLDPQLQAFTWGTTGPWFHQHDPDFLDNGNILLYDNLGNLNGKGGRTRILEFNPVTHAIAWSFTGSENDKLYSEVRGSQDRLPNGNTLITESEGGRILEVTMDNEIVWEFRTPVCYKNDSTLVAATCFASRREPTYFTPEFISCLKQ